MIQPAYNINMYVGIHVYTAVYIAIASLWLCSNAIDIPVAINQ